VVLRLKDKETIVAELQEVANNSLSVIAADYRGLTVSEMDQLRDAARKSGVYLRVVRNTLSRRAFEGTEFKCMQDALTGPVILAFSRDEPGAAARILKDFIVDHEKITVKAIAIGGELLAANELNAVATLPTRDEAIAMLMGVMQAPIVKLVRTLNETNAKLVRTVAAVAAKKENQ
jgi:large subunit ribosomal protein L10